MKTEALDKRYPSLAFLLRMDETALPPFALHEEEIDKEVSEATRRLKTENNVSKDFCRAIFSLGAKEFKELSTSDISNKVEQECSGSDKNCWATCPK